MKVIQKEIVLNFVLSRKQEDGGFSFAQEAPATFEDTYYALQILHELEISYDEEKTTDFIRLIEKSRLLVKHLFQLAHLSKTYKLSLPWLNGIIEKSCFVQATDSESIYYSAKLARIVNNANLMNKLKEKRIQISNKEHLLTELCWKAIALKKLRVDFNEDAVAERIKGFQGHDSGFSFRKKGAPSFMEGTYLAIEALSELKQQPRDVQKCIMFVEMCRANNGGFGRQITTVPTLESTYHAIKSLKLLGMIKK